MQQCKTWFKPTEGKKLWHAKNNVMSRVCEFNRVANSRHNSASKCGLCVNIAWLPVENVGLKSRADVSGGRTFLTSESRRQSPDEDRVYDAYEILKTGRILLMIRVRILKFPEHSTTLMKIMCQCHGTESCKRLPELRKITSRDTGISVRWSEM